MVNFMMKKLSSLLLCLVFGIIFIGCDKHYNTESNKDQKNISLVDLYKEGEDYYLGTNGKEKDYKHAFEIFKKVAEQGHTKAQVDLAQMYYDGVGTSTNYEQAFFWLEKAAKSEEPAAFYNLGVMYKEGKYVKQNNARALKYFEQSAKKRIFGSSIYFRNDVLSG